MVRTATFLAVLFAAQWSMADDLLCISFSDSSIMQSGKRVDCDLYYILVGDNGSLDQGDLIQLTKLHEDPDSFYHSKARFKLSDDDQLTVYWPAGDKKVGDTEKGRLELVNEKSGRFTYTIDQHDDESQVGEKMRVRLVDFDSLPTWVREHVMPTIVSKLPLEEQLQYHRLQAMQIKATSDIVQGYLNAID